MATSPQWNVSKAKHGDLDVTGSPEENNEVVSPLAFTIQFDDQKVDDSKKLKIQERLSSSFALKHRRNPSLPDFGAVRPPDKLPSPLSSQYVPTLGKGTGLSRPCYNSEGYFSSDQEDEAARLKHGPQKSVQEKSCVRNPLKKISPIEEIKNMNTSLSQVNGGDSKLNLQKHVKNSRRSSLNDIDVNKIKMSYQNKEQKEKFMSLDEKKFTSLDEKKFTINHDDTYDVENKSDTVSEAGTYTVDKDEESEKNKSVKNVEEAEKSEEIEDGGEDYLNVSQGSTNYHANHKWINDWVCKVAEQNLNYAVQEPPIIQSKYSGSGGSSPSASKIPSPVNTLSLKFRGKQVKSADAKTSKTGDKSFVSRFNGTSQHRRSSSLSAKDYAEHRTSDSSLETESYLRTTESVVTAMQNRMKMSLDQDKPSRREPKVMLKEKPHPPSTASDTDTNSDNDGKTFKKPLGNPFTSARLNRAFSLRRAKADTEGEQKKSSTSNREEARPTTPHELKRSGTTRSTPSPNPVKSKPPLTSPFNRTDCGRFSMRSTVATPKTINGTNPVPKKDVKKPSANGRSNSSLSSREVDFQNWKRRKSFDPMKAAAEGRKKELLARKVAMNQPMTQSVNLGTTVRTRNGNPVLRSASFHSTPQGAQSMEAEEEVLSPEEFEDSPGSSWVSNQPVLPPNSPSKFSRATLPGGATGSSRCSLQSAASETHSSPSQRARSEVIDGLVMSAIHDLSYKLKLKSCNLLKKLNSHYDADEERSDRLRDEIAGLESRRNSGSSPNHRTSSRDLSSTLKNLKNIENVLTVLDDVLFDENIEVCIDN